LKRFSESLGRGGRPHERHDPRTGQHGGPAASAQAPPRLKELYRALVRRLHPDSQREMTAQKTEWWHQAQAAYESGDVEQLEVILTLCEVGESGTTAHTSASLLQRITAQLKSSLREIKRQLTQRRRDPAWNFSRRADHEVLEFQMRRALTEDLQRMRDRWRETQELIAGWKRAAEHLKPPRRRKRQPRDMEVPF
jgi:DNA-binding transcriptional MerR regulator